jgi:hypothetical protein
LLLKARMNTHEISALIVIPDWAIWVGIGMWTVSTALTVYQMWLRRKWFHKWSASDL